MGSLFSVCFLQKVCTCPGMRTDRMSTGLPVLESCAPGLSGCTRSLFWGLVGSGVGEMTFHEMSLYCCGNEMLAFVARDLFCSETCGGTVEMVVACGLDVAMGCSSANLLPKRVMWRAVSMHIKCPVTRFVRLLFLLPLRLSG